MFFLILYNNSCMPSILICKLWLLVCNQMHRHRTNAWTLITSSLVQQGQLGALCQWILKILHGVTLILQSKGYCSYTYTLTETPLSLSAYQQEPPPSLFHIQWWSTEQIKHANNTFVFVHSGVLALGWADSRVIGPVIVWEGPRAGWGQGAGPLTSLLYWGTVQTWARAGRGPAASGGAGRRDGVRGGAT